MSAKVIESNQAEQGLLENSSQNIILTSRRHL
jgi:hypothetical protein